MPAGLEATKSTSGVLAEALQGQSDDELKALGLTRKPAPKRKPGSRWDGRVAGMSVKEYRELKWSVDAGYAKVFGRGPSYTCRPALPNILGKKPNNFQVGDIHRSFSCTLPVRPSYSMGMQSFKPPLEKSPGPTEYKIKSTMDPNRHPTAPKHTGPRFGTEILLASDGTGLPGPGEYDVHNTFVNSSAVKKRPNFSIQGREAWRPRTEAPGPGIGAYDYDQATRVGKITPIHWTAQGKTEPLAKPRGERRYISPGPPHYDCPGAGARNEKVNKEKEPVWKFGTESRGLL